MLLSVIEFCISITSILAIHLERVPCARASSQIVLVLPCFCFVLFFPPFVFARLLLFCVRCASFRSFIHSCRFRQRWCCCLIIITIQQYHSMLDVYKQIQTISFFTFKCHFRKLKKNLLPFPFFLFAQKLIDLYYECSFFFTPKTVPFFSSSFIKLKAFIHRILYRGISYLHTHIINWRNNVLLFMYIFFSEYLTFFPFAYPSCRWEIAKKTTKKKRDRWHERTKKKKQHQQQQQMPYCMKKRRPKAKNIGEYLVYLVSFTETLAVK